MTSSQTKFAIETKLLNKVYRNKRSLTNKHALKDVSIEIEHGQIYGLLGPNGAGKSTFINILGNLVLKTSGVAKIWGYDIEKNPRNARSAIGIVPQELNLDPFFTPIEVLETQAGLYGVPKKDRHSMELLKTLRLEDQAHAYARSLSGGMRRRLLLAKAMTHSPPVLVLDEPTAGVDIELRHQLWEYVKKLNREGTTILLTTHYLEEAQSLCDRIGIINHGKVVADAPTKDLINSLDRKQVLIKTEKPLYACPSLKGVTDVILNEENVLNIIYQPTKIDFDCILSQLQDKEINIQDIITKEADLEDIFLELTNTNE
jgi:ABC-2 type transport system ATP-binding protein